MYTRQNKTKKNQTQPQINDENGLCSILRKLPQFPLVFSPVSRFSPTGPEGTFLSGEGRWMVVGDQDPRFPLRPSPTALFLTSYSGFPCTNMPRSPSHPSSRGGRRVGESDGKGLGAYQLLLLVELQRGPCRWAPGRGRCPGRSPAGFGVLPSSKDAPKPLSISRCVNMANLFYSFSVHYTQRYIYIYTYISLYIDTYRYIYIYYL